MKKLEDRAKVLTETLKDTDISGFEEAADEAFSLEDEPEITNENVSEDFIQEQKEMMLDGSANDEPEFIDEELTE
ncbi:hypothetical protein, partial [Pseudomonas aeruginosa]|uniref:hypothetical protein n=1 Tax=Pseudomonas aeruginosa TaxID=287 RepID=UPI0031B693BB